MFSILYTLPIGTTRPRRVRENERPSVGLGEKMRGRHKGCENGHGEVRGAVHGHQDGEGGKVQRPFQARPVRRHRVHVHQAPVAQRRRAGRLPVVRLQVGGDEHTDGAVQRPGGGHAQGDTTERGRVPGHRAERGRRGRGGRGRSHAGQRVVQVFEFYRLSRTGSESAVRRRHGRQNVHGVLAEEFPDGRGPVVARHCCPEIRSRLLGK